MAKGYTHIDNDILRGLARLRISGATFNVLIAIINNTLSFHRRQHELSNGFLVKATGLNESSVIRAIKELNSLGIIEITRECAGSHPRTIKLLTGKIAMMAKLEGGGGSSASNSTGNSASILTGNSAIQEIKKENKENKEKEKGIFSSPERKPTLEELAARSWAEEDDEEDNDGDL